MTGIDSAPRTLAREIAQFLGSCVASTREVRNAIDEAGRRQAMLKRGAPSEECVVESLLRCLLTHDLQTRYGLPAANVPQWVNASHVAARGVCVSRRLHEHVIEDEVWDRSWIEFQAAHAEVNIHVPGRTSPARADLFLMASGGIVSVEFKYLRPGSLPNVNSCVEQMARYLRHHAASVFVAYAAAPEADRLGECLGKMRGKLTDDRAEVVCVPGAAVQV